MTNTPVDEIIEFGGQHYIDTGRNKLSLINALGYESWSVAINGEAKNEKR